MAITKIPAAGFTGNNFRNIIINGDMSIAQRGTSFPGLTNGNNSDYLVDRFCFYESGSESYVIDASQSTDVPSGQGFANSLKYLVDTADTSLGSLGGVGVNYRFEGQMLQYLKKGTANAESLTLSFWFKSSLTGTYIASLDDKDNDRTISKSYTVNTADTWEKKTVTFEGDTTGAFDNDNDRSMDLTFWFSAGSGYQSGTLQTSWGTTTTANRAVGQVDWSATANNELYITGVQLEAGTTASDFEFLPVDVNLQRCQRYLYVILEGTLKYFADAIYYTNTHLRFSVNPKVILRTEPTLVSNITSNTARIYRNGTYDQVSGPFSLGGGESNFYMISTTTGVSGTAGQAGHMYSTNADNYFYLDAEL
jgi:hypothetical protein